MDRKDKENRKEAKTKAKKQRNLGSKPRPKTASSPMVKARTSVVHSTQESAKLKATPRSARKVTAPTFAANVARLGTLLRIAHPTVEATADTTGSPTVGARTSESETVRIERIISPGLIR